MDRNNSIQKLKNEVFDLLVIGGGATGAGIALDAASRGLKVALVERDDFASSTSSRSTKMFHGGVRYLEKAILNLDKENYNLVKEGLYERGLALKNNPHLSKTCQFITPLYSWYDLFKVYIGLKLYDFLSGRFSIGSSGYLSRFRVIKDFPQINQEGLKGAVTYYDGQFNDARVNLNIIKTAVKHGAVITNYMEVKSFIKDDGVISGVILEDKNSGEHFNFYGKNIVNATGAFSDALRKKSDNEVKELIKVSSGIHIVVDKKFSSDLGMMIPKTKDGRTLFILPWENQTLIGTTDEPAKLSEHPKVSEKDIEYLLNHINKYFSVDIKRDDIKAYWSGLRPLVVDESKENTQEILRIHKIEIDKNGLISVMGGKWTAYRAMAEQTVDMIVKTKNIKVKASQTSELKIFGADKYNFEYYKDIVKKYKLEEDVALHLNRYYGDQVDLVLDLANNNDLFQRIHPLYPFIKAEVIYSCKEEMVVSAMDFLARRIPLAMIDFHVTKEVLDEVIGLLAYELNWDEKRQKQEKELVLLRLDEAI